jgi:hypothetical protein
MQEVYDKVAVFIASSDNTRDVFARVFPSLIRHWRGCPYRIYAGFNTPQVGPDGFTPVYAPVSGWRNELAAQIETLPAEYVLLLLDDFLILQTVDTDRVVALIGMAVSEGLAYLRLIPLRRALVPRVVVACRGPRTREIEAIPETDPYHSSLQAVLWRRTHLLECLREEENIWRFETIRPYDAVHYSICGPAPIRYRHLVEKGRWLPDARRLLRQAGLRDDLGTRGRWPWTYQLRGWVARVRFELLGYSMMRSRRALAARLSRAWSNG